MARTPLTYAHDKFQANKFNGKKSNVMVLKIDLDP